MIWFFEISRQIQYFSSEYLLLDWVIFNVCFLMDSLYNNSYVVPHAISTPLPPLVLL